MAATATTSTAKRRPSWYVRIIMLGFRTLLLTLLFAAFGMGAGLFVGIIGTATMGLIHHQQPDMANAYRHVAIPAAIAFGGGAFLWNFVQSIRRFFNWEK